jgi:hypothetical protein
MASGRKATLLTVAEAASLDAIRSGAGMQSHIALQAKLTLKEAISSIRKLAAAGFVIRRERYSLGSHTAREASRCDYRREPRAVARGKRFGKIRPGTSADRLVALLDRPRRGPELANELAVSLQRVH